MGSACEFPSAAVALAAPSAASASSLYNVAVATKQTAFTGVLDVAGGSNQRWNFVEQGTGWGSSYEIVNQKSGLCLTTNGVAGAPLYVTYCNADNPRQNWTTGIGPITVSRYSLSFGGSPIVNGSSGLAIDVQGATGLAGTPIVGWRSTNTDNQLFAYWFWS